MSRYIDADEILKKKWDVPFNGKYIQVVDVGDIEDMPTADVKEVVRGEWIQMGSRTRCSNYRCSNYRCTNYRCTNCTKVNDEISDFCPMCGADMRGRDNES